MMAMDAPNSLTLTRIRQKITAPFLRRKNPGYPVEVCQYENDNKERPTSPQRRLKRHSILLELRQNIKANCLRGGTSNNEAFLPNNKVGQLVTKETVLLALQDTRIEKEKHGELAIWVLQRSKRLFLTLVFMTGTSERLSWLEYLKDDGVDDNALPLRFYTSILPYYGVSKEREKDKAQKFYSFQDWEDNELILFGNYQWIFSAPVLGASTKFRHQLHSKQPLPLFNLKKSKGTFGEIWSGEIHRAHTILGADNVESQGIPVSIKCVRPSDNLDPFFDINTGKFKAAHPIISPLRAKPIAAYTRNGEDFIIFQWLDGGGLQN
ncbi:hypothetical protein GGR51DRAFT_499708 [Nemania sp. FL0031]|nr:hypothetical protein GGR51DRAFT_499708 [Nemania sp. FL0031]